MLFKKKKDYTYKDDRLNIESVLKALQEVSASEKVVNALPELAQKLNRATRELEQGAELNTENSKLAFEKINKSIENFNKLLKKQESELLTILTKHVQDILDAVSARIKLGR